MILNKEQLEQYVDAQHYADRFVPLQVNELVEFRGGLRVTETGYECNVELPVETYNGEYRIDTGIYRVQFREDAGFPSGVVPFILPSSNALSVGCVASPRLVTDDLWTLLSVNRNMVIEEDAVVGVLVAFDTNEINDIRDIIADMQIRPTDPGDTDDN